MEWRAAPSIKKSKLFFNYGVKSYELNGPAPPTKQLFSSFFTFSLQRQANQSMEEEWRWVGRQQKPITNCRGHISLWEMKERPGNQSTPFHSIDWRKRKENF